MISKLDQSNALIKKHQNSSLRHKRTKTSQAGETELQMKVKSLDVMFRDIPVESPLYFRNSYQVLDKSNGLVEEPTSVVKGNAIVGSLDPEVDFRKRASIRSNYDQKQERIINLTCVQT